MVAFTLIEEMHGPLWGTVAGMTFGIAEIGFEKFKYKKVSRMTWISNLLILGLGGISIVSQDGIWFKLQPALFEGFFAALLIGSVILKKPFLLAMTEKQNGSVPDAVKPLMSSMTVRLGIFFAFHAALATYAALYWTTSQWAWLKGAGVGLSFLVYMVFEFFWIRHSVRRNLKRPSQVSEPSQENKSS